MSVTITLGGNPDEIGPALETAIQLTKRLKTTLTGLCAMPDPANAVVYITGAETVALGASAIETMTKAQERLVEEHKTHFEDAAKAAGPWLTAAFNKERGSEALHGAAYASLADAFVVPKESTQSNHPLNPVFEHVLMEANLPLVLAPAAPIESDTCVIAWDGSPLAARAVKMHLPLISTFSKVIIAENPDRVRHQWSIACKDSTERLTEMLHEQRLETVLETLDGKVSDSLLACAKSHDASLIVMGAYGHNRIGQMLFGGTTSRLLHNQDSPALALCH